MTIRTASATVPALQMPATTTETGGRAAQALPLSPMPATAIRKTRGGIYGLAKIDHRGRVTDAAVERALGWPPGTRLNVEETGGVIVVRAYERGVFTMSNQGHLRLPLPVRRWCGLDAGDQVLLVVGQLADRLFAYPAARLGELLAEHQRALLGGQR
jgi:bifunctional DNA-binding transcriptional regulator/antitoxin component of YhaV-PrlF toxin-antitoxin module